MLALVSPRVRKEEEEEWKDTARRLLAIRGALDELRGEWIGKSKEYQERWIFKQTRLHEQFGIERTMLEILFPEVKFKQFVVFCRQPHRYMIKSVLLFYDSTTSTSIPVSPFPPNQAKTCIEGIMDPFHCM